MGVAMFGAIFASRIVAELADRVPAGAGAISSAEINPAALASTARVGARLLHRLLHRLAADGLPDRGRRSCWSPSSSPGCSRSGRSARRSRAETWARPSPSPQDTDSLREITRCLTRHVGRERTRDFVAGVVERAGVDLDVPEAWVLTRARDGVIPPEALDAQLAEDRGLLILAIDKLRTRELVVVAGPGEGPMPAKNRRRRPRERPSIRSSRRPGANGSWRWSPTGSPTTTPSSTGWSPTWRGN